MPLGNFRYAPRIALPITAIRYIALVGPRDVRTRVQDTLGGAPRKTLNVQREHRA